MKFFITPNYSVALNPKCGSSSLARAIIAAHHPELEAVLQSAAYPPGVTPATARLQLQGMCPGEQVPTKPVMLIVREPVARFRSAMAQYRLTDVDAVLGALPTGANVTIGNGKEVLLQADPHFNFQKNKALGPATLYRMDDLDLAAIALGLSLPLPTINTASGEKPTLTPAQEQQVLAYYAEDVALYSSIPPGQPLQYLGAPIPVPEPEVVPVPDSITATQIRLWLVRNGISMEQVYAAIAAIPDPQSRAEAEVLWEYAPYIERSNPLVEMLGVGFNMDSAAIDNAFREAILI